MANIGKLFLAVQSRLAYARRANFKLEPRLSFALDKTEIAFLQGQLHGLTQVVLASNALFPSELRACLALRTLDRAWQQYREDRGIALGQRLVGAECATERDAFLKLVLIALPSRTSSLGEAVALVRKMAIRPLAVEAKQSEVVVVESLDGISEARSWLLEPRLPEDPLQRLSAVVDRLRYSDGREEDTLSATASTPCWALNLLALTQSKSFGLLDHDCPLPGIVDRRAFRSDWSTSERRESIRNSLSRALSRSAAEIAATLHARQAFMLRCSQLQSNSRAYAAWLLIYALGGLTAAQLARSLNATKAGAGKILDQLEVAGLLANGSPST